MKTNHTNSLFGWLCTVLLLVALFFSLAAPPPAEAQTSATSTNVLTGIPSVIMGGATSNTVSGEVTLHQGKGISFYPYISGTNANATNTITISFDLSGDGTNWTTTGPLSGTVTANGATAVRGFFTFTPTQMNGVRKMRTKSFVSNSGAGTNTFITNIVYSVPW